MTQDAKMADLEVFRLSAKMCGYTLDIDPYVPALVVRAPDGGLHRWNPFTNSDQRWECVEELLRTHVVEEETAHCVWNRKGFMLDGGVFFDCNDNEFPARALAYLARRNGNV